TVGTLGARAARGLPRLGVAERPLGLGGLAQVLGEVVRGTGLIRAVHRGDRGRRQFGTAVLRGDRRVVPLGDLAGEDSGKGRGVQLQTVDTLQVVHDGDRPDHHRQVERLTAGALGVGFRLLFGLERRVGAGEVGGPGDEGLNARAGTRALVVDLRIGTLTLVRLDPLVHGVLLGGGALRREIAGHAVRIGRRGAAGG